jgi:hypothetical protein
MGLHFSRSHLKDLSIQSPLTTHKEMWRIYSNPDPHDCNWSGHCDLLQKMIGIYAPTTEKNNTDLINRFDIYFLWYGSYAINGLEMLKLMKLLFTQSCSDQVLLTVFILIIYFYNLLSSWGNGYKKHICFLQTIRICSLSLYIRTTQAYTNPCRHSLETQWDRRTDRHVGDGRTDRQKLLVPFGFTN